jgi:hypothetical protein
MSKTVATLIGVVLIVIGLHAFRMMHESSISGQVISGDNKVWVHLVSGQDSMKAMITGGSFKFKVKPGSWKVRVQNSETIYDEGLVEVPEGSSLDLGTIRLN